MPRKKKETAEPLEEKPVSRKAERRSLWPAIRFTALTLATVLTVFGAAFAVWTAEQAVLADSRFRFAPGDAITDQFLTVSGVRNASKTAILRVFNYSHDSWVSKYGNPIRSCHVLCYFFASVEPYNTGYAGCSDGVEGVHNILCGGVRRRNSIWSPT